MLICIEGPDGSGKNTQVDLLAEKLQAEVISFPNYESPTGAAIKSHLGRVWAADLNPEYPDAYLEVRYNLDALVFQALMTVNRLEKVEEIRKAQHDNKDLILNRYWPSGYVYGSADGLDEKWLLEIHKTLPQPDLFILLDVDVDTSFQRRPDRRDRYENNRPFMEKVAKTYLPLWLKNDWKNWIVIDGRKSVDEVHEAIMRSVMARRVEKLG